MCAYKRQREETEREGRQERRMVQFRIFFRTM